MDQQAGTPTVPEPTDVPRQRRARAWRRGFVAGLVLFLGLGALNLFGVRTSTATASGGGHRLALTYATVSRPGLATPWSLQVRRAGGFPEGLTVAVTSSYLEAFDENGLSPEPVAETDDGERTYWRFGPSAGDTVTVSLDGRVEPGVQLTRVRGRVEVLAGPGGPALVGVGFSTIVMP